MDRNFDGAYFRIKRNDKYENVCFSDMTRGERKKVMENRSVEWLQGMCEILADALKEVGDEFDIVRDW